MRLARWTAPLLAVTAALSTLGCDVELEVELVNVKGLKPGFKIGAKKDGGKLTGTVGSSGEVTIKYKGEEIHHVSGLKPGSDFEYEPEDPWVVQVPTGFGVDFAYAVSETNGSVHPLKIYDLASFVPNPNGDVYTAEPGMDLICIGYDLETTPNDDYTIHVQLDAPAPGIYEMKIINAVIVTDDTGQQALLPVEPVEYDFAQVQSWPYVQQIFAVDPDIEMLDGEALGLPSPELWQYCKIELAGAQPGWDFDQSAELYPVGQEWNQVWTDWGYSVIGDQDADGIADMVVRFSKSSLLSTVGSGVNKVVISGNLWGGGWSSYESMLWLTLGIDPDLSLSIPLSEEEMIAPTTLDWWIDMQVLGSPSVLFDYWIDATLPDGTVIPVPQASGLNLPQGFAFSGLWGIGIPAGLQPGNYRFDNIFGDYNTGQVYAADGFDAFVGIQ